MRSFNLKDYVLDGYRVVVVQRWLTPFISWYCGYVVVPASHPLAQRYRGQEDIDGHEVDEVICAHVPGGLTYASFNPPGGCQGEGLWLGFDTGHYGMEGLGVDEVEVACRRLVARLQEIERGRWPGSQG